MTPARWSVQVPIDINELKKVRQSLAQFLERQALAREVIDDAQLIAEEVLVNIIEYGYADQAAGQIEFDLELSDGRLQMRFEDGGTPFNPLTEIALPNLSQLDDEERSFGGLGFFLVRELAEQLEYSYQEGKNLLVILLSNKARD